MKAWGWIWLLSGFFLQSRAQPVDFTGLERAVSSGNRKETEMLFSMVSAQMMGQPGNTPDLIHLLKLTRELSRSGMADLVWPGLLRLSGGAASGMHLSDSIRLSLLSELGAAFYYDNRFRQADSVFRSTLAFFDEPGKLLQPEYAFSCNFLGLTGMRLGNLDSALIWFEKAKSVRIKIYGKDHPSVGSVYNNLGLLYKNKGDYSAAIQHYRKAIDIKRTANDPSVYLNLLNLGELYGLRGEYSGALSFYKQADSILSQEKPSLKQADLYLNSGAMMYNLQGYQEALDFFMKALRIYESLTGESSIQTGKVYQNLANVYSGLGDRKEEMNAVRKALSIHERQLEPGHADLAPLYNNLGMVFQNWNQYDSSLYFLKKARDIYLSLPEDQTEKLSNTLINMAVAYQYSGKVDSALACYTQSAEKLENHTGGRHPYLSLTYNSLSRNYLKSGWYHQADSLADRAIVANFPAGHGMNDQLNACFDPVLLFESWILKGTISWKSDPWSVANAEKAFFYFRKADTLLSFQRNFLFNSSDKITFSKNTRFLAESSLECLVNSQAAGHSQTLFADGFRFAEKSRNLVLLQTMQEEEARHLSGIPDSMLAREEEMRGNISALNHQIDTNKGKINTDKLEDQLFNERKNYRNLVEQMEKEYPDYYQLKYSDSLPAISGLQKSIGEGMALLAYFTGDSAIYRFTLLNDQHILDRSRFTDLEDLITGFRKGITLRLDEVYREKAGQLYTLLFPAELPQNVNRLIIVPDGALSAVPFEALLFSRPPGNEGFSGWPFLVSKYDISYAPSTAIWNKLTESSRSAKEIPSSLLAFAPVFEGKEEKTGKTISMPGLPWMNNSFWMESLPATRNEIIRIDSLFKGKGLVSEYHLSGDATENSFRTAGLQQYGYLHVATHGFVNDLHPGLSGLYFHPAMDSPEDPVLYLGEIYQLKLNARLVALSACETGLGKLAAGEGILGFSRAFLLAGARNLLLSLWQVNDASTTELMIRFYHAHIVKELSLAASIREAKMSLIKNPGTSHPYFWAGFVLTGN